jgi:hypothetical protein
MAGQLIPFGYAGRSDKESLERLDALMQEHSNALVIDIRFVPFSRIFPDFNKYILGRRYNRNNRVGYFWEGDHLGNLNYKGEGGIKLAHPEIGIPMLVKWLEEGRTLILLCACAHYGRCHRKKIVELVQEALPGVEVLL